MFLMFTGTIFLVISVVVFLIGLFQKSKKIKQIGVGVLMVSISCFALIGFWYKIVTPYIYSQQQKDFVGIYIPHESAERLLSTNNLLRTEIQLNLKDDGIFEFDSISQMSLHKEGKWEAGGVDGTFNFYDSKGNLIEWAMPSGGGDSCGLSIDFIVEDKNAYTETESIYFIKVN